MKKNIFGFFIIEMLTTLNVSAQETLKGLYYNFLNYPPENNLAFILSDHQSDLFFVIELSVGNEDNNLLNISKDSHSSNFEMTRFVSIRSPKSNSLGSLYCSELKNKVTKPLNFVISN